MGGQDIRNRTFDYSIRIVRLTDSLLGAGGAAKILGRQLLRSGTSIGANLEEAEGGHSRADFAAKCSVALKEARETRYWLRLLVSSDLILESRVKDLIQETEEITAILISIVSKSKSDVKSDNQHRIAEIQAKHHNAYKPWTTEQDKDLETLYKEGKEINGLMNHFGRQKGAILARLQKLGLLTEEERGRG